MTAVRTPDTLRADLTEVRDLLAASKREAEALLERRAHLVRALSTAGVRRAEIAADAGVSLHMVKLILSARGPVR